MTEGTEKQPEERAPAKRTRRRSPRKPATDAAGAKTENRNDTGVKEAVPAAEGQPASGAAPDAPTRSTAVRRRRPRSAKPKTTGEQPVAGSEANEPEGAKAPVPVEQRQPAAASSDEPPTSQASGTATPARRRRSRGPRKKEPEDQAASAASAAATPAGDNGDEANKTVRKKKRTTRRPRSDRPLPEPSGPRTMLITKGADRTQIAVLEERELIEHYVAHREDQSIVGNVYLGRVQNVLPGMEAAFLDIGEARNAVLYAGELGYDEELDGPAPRIESILKSGQTVLAQVTKDPMGSKGARLTTEVSIAGRYLVMVPDADSLGISRRLPDDERKRLRDIGQKIRPSGFGLIVRTAAEGAIEEDLTRDVNRLMRIWKDLEAKSKRSKAPKLIHSEPELAIRVVRDLFTSDVEKVVVDDRAVYDELVGYVTEVTPELGKRIDFYEDDLPLFEKFHVVEQIRKAVDRKVWLRSGGHIVIDRTEAMTVIDVNTGRFVGKSNLEETVFQTNVEAAKEIAKQLRLRDIGGIIVIDFIDMLYERNRDELQRTLRGALARDKTRTQVFGVSELGTVQMTRKNVSEGLLEAFSERCEACEGRGVILTDMD